jgi:hypothetical protein
MKLWILILAPTLMAITAPDIQAHKLVTLNGENQQHQHVYRRQQYGKPLQQGHLYSSSGDGGMVIWGSGSQSDYGKMNGRRDGPIIDDQQTLPDRNPKAQKKFGSQVRGYGKPLRNY